MVLLKDVDTMTNKHETILSIEKILNEVNTGQINTVCKRIKPHELGNYLVLEETT